MKYLKTHSKKNFLHLPKIICTLVILCFLLFESKSATQGIKNGITLLLTTVIPSLFPFLVLSSYVATSKSFLILSKLFKPLTNKFFKINENGVIPIILGLLGGYPIGAKVTADLYSSNRLTKNEAERLMYFSVNSGPAFTLTAVGSGMLNNTRYGVILYLSAILTSLTIGFFCRFLSNKTSIESKEIIIPKNHEFAFINSVSSGAKAIIDISSWVLTFSCISEIIKTFNLNENVKLFLNSVLEVTNGCNLCTGKVSLPVISAILGFGSFSVICQVSPYLKKCQVKMKNFIVSRILNASLSAFFTFNLLKLFPEALKTSVVFEVNNQPVMLSYTGTATIILLLMCLIFILQVDNRKKVC